MHHHPSSSNQIRVLVSDDSRVHTELLADVLRRDGQLEVTTSLSSSEELLAQLNQSSVDVLLIGPTLDGLPGRGFEVLRDLQSSSYFVPSIMAPQLLSARSGFGSVPSRCKGCLQQRRVCKLRVPEILSH